MNINHPSKPDEKPLRARRLAYCRADGVAVFTTTIHGEDAPPLVDGLTAVELAEPMPVSPGPFHEFNTSTMTWADPRTDQQKAQNEWTRVRSRRDSLLRASDFTQLSDSPKNKQVWATYRQALRDITTQPDPFNLTWPVEP